MGATHRRIEELRAGPEEDDGASDQGERRRWLPRVSGGGGRDGRSQNSPVKTKGASSGRITPSGGVDGLLERRRRCSASGRGCSARFGAPLRKKYMREIERGKGNTTGENRRYWEPAVATKFTVKASVGGASPARSGWRYRAHDLLIFPKIG